MKSILTHSSYSPARGGHAPGDLREAFSDAIEAYEALETGEQEPVVKIRGKDFTVRQVCGMLWNCSDILPSNLHSSLRDLANWPYEGPSRRTYASGARFLAALYDSAKPKAAA